ncbi:hypothetical protein MCC01970_00840 [Bifidobacteriaceae bacterium MCC01970]|nr:hypothetical protein MCC01970_00840 [Bifidobacteriaceae bacterium MCC01970]
MSWKGSRTRNIRRTVLFTDEEWNHVYERYQVEAGDGQSFSKWARSTLSEPFTITVEINADTDRLHEQIRGMANNINQIAHVANARRNISQETIREATLLLRLVQEKLDGLHEENLILIEKQAAHAYGKQAE